MIKNKKNDCNCGNSCKCQKEDENIFKPLKNDFNGGRRFFISKFDLFEFIDENYDLLGDRLPKFDIDELELIELVEKEFELYRFNHNNRVNRGMEAFKTESRALRLDIIDSKPVLVEISIEECIKINLFKEQYESIFTMGLIPETRALILKDPVVNYLASKEPSFYLDLLCGGEYNDKN